MPSVPMLSAFPKRKVGRRAEPRTKPMLASTDVNDMSALCILFAVCSPLKWVIFEVVGHGLNGQVHCTVYFLFCHETLPSIPCHIYIYMVTPPPPPRSTPATSTRFPEVASLHWTLLIYAENTVNGDTMVPFAMCMQTVLLQVAGLICV